MKKRVLPSTFFTMLVIQFLSLLCILSSPILVQTIPSTVKIGGNIGYDIYGFIFGDDYSGAKIAIENINNDPTILPNTTLELIIMNTAYNRIMAMNNILLFAQMENIQTIFCCTTAAETTLSGFATDVYNMAMLSHQATSDLLSDRNSYPYFNRIVPTDKYQSRAIIDILHYLSRESGIKKYDQFSIIATSDQYGVDGAREIISLSSEEKIKILTFQQFLPGAFDISIEIMELERSKARVFIGIMGPIDFGNVLTNANQANLIGDKYVWLCFDACATEFVYSNIYNYYYTDEQLRYLMSGVIGITNWRASGQLFDSFVEQWNSLDPEEYPSAGPDTTPSNLTTYAYDAMYFLAKAIESMITLGAIDDSGFISDIDLYVDTIRSTVIQGLTGEIQLDSIGNRIASYNIINFQSSSDYPIVVGSWIPEVGLNITTPFEFFDGTTSIPDIDVRPPFEYWDCQDGKKRIDETGKTVKLKKPDGSNPRNIDITYYCDSFIDCSNFSDESVDCSTNYKDLFIVFGVITGVLIVIAILLLIITVLFGFIFPKHRFRSSSPLFLIVMIVACILGYSSIYAWYGKPRAVACGFQPWLLGIGVILLISALSAKTFRIWRIFKSPMNRKVITDLELFILMCIMMAPSILILFLWTLISTPTATMKEVDNEDHFVCETGGFTGPPGGYIFFFIFIGYGGILLAFGGFLSIVTRKVPSAYNESKLIAVSIYNLVFLSCAIIPVVVVLNSINPFVSWIIRSVGIIYAFTTTLWLQFFPKIFGLLIFDRCRNVKLYGAKTLSDIDRSKSRDQTGSSGHALANIPESNSFSSDLS